MEKSWKQLIEKQFSSSDCKFNILECSDHGMGKIALIMRDELIFRIVYDRGPIHISISLPKPYEVNENKKTEEWIDVIHLVNFSSDNPKILFPSFYWQFELNTTEMYLRFYKETLISNFELIKESISKLEMKKLSEFINYQKKENLENLTHGTIDHK